MEGNNMATAAENDGQVNVDLEQVIQEKGKYIKELQMMVEEIVLLEYKEKYLGDDEDILVKKLLKNGSMQLIKEIKHQEESGRLGTCNELVEDLKKRISLFEKEKNLLEIAIREKKEKNNLIAELAILKNGIENIQREMTNQRRYNLRGNGNNNRNKGFGKRSFEKVVCHKCGKEGHIALGCREIINKENNLCVFYNKFDSKRRKYDYSGLSKEKIIEIYKDVFFFDKDETISFCKLEVCEYNTPRDKKVVKKGVMCPQSLEKKAQEYLNQLIKRKIIRRSESTWRNPIRFIEKINGDIRLVVNMMALNDLVEKDPFKIRNMREILYTTKGSLVFSVMDLKEAFYSIENKESDKHKTAFEFKGEIYEFNSMIMGFKNSPMIMAKVMKKMCGDLVGKGLEFWYDDVVIYAKSRYEHDMILFEFLERCRKNNLRVNKEKFQFALSEVQLLGVRINGNDIIALDEQKENILKSNKPRNISEMRSLLGKINWFRNFIENLATKTYNLTNSLKIKNGNSWYWNEKMEKELDAIKVEIKNLNKLKMIDFDKPIVLRTDASNVGLGAVLMQEDIKGELRPIEWASKKLTATESRYGITEKEMLAVVFGIEKFSYELKGRHFTLETDHKALLNIREKPNFDNPRVLRWIEKIMQYDFKVKYRKGENMGLADDLSRNHINKSKYELKSSNKIKERRWNKHVQIKDGKEYWNFDNGDVKEIPETNIRKEICLDFHNRVGHKGVLYTYHEIKKKYYWPGLKSTVEKICKECELCQIENRKKNVPSEYITTYKPMQLVAFDLLTLEENEGYILVGIDYFTRFICTKFLRNKTSQGIVDSVIKMMEDGFIPEKIITDSGREFTSDMFKRMCKNYGIAHSVVSVENHRSNGRIERVVGTLRELARKNSLDDIEEKFNTVTDIYNTSYHNSIKTSPKEAFENYEDLDLILRNQNNAKIGKHKVKIKEEIFKIGDNVRIAQYDNINKYERGRFKRLGKIISKCNKNSYLVQYIDSGKITKKNQKSLKKIVPCNS